MSNYDPTDIKSQERKQEDAALRKTLAKDTEESDLKWLMGSKRGRRIVWRLLDRAGVFRSSWNTNSMTMAFVEGTKNEGYRTLAMIHAICPELYSTMAKEQANEQRTADDGSRNDH